MFLTTPPSTTGMFGVLTMHLVRLVNYGHSYQSAKDLFELLRVFPLRSSSYHLFKPRRNLLTWPVIDKTMSKLRKLHLLEFDSKKQKAYGKLHSNVSTKIEYYVHKKEGLQIRATNKEDKNKDEIESWKGIIDADNGMLHFLPSDALSFLFL